MIAFDSCKYVNILISFGWKETNKFIQKIMDRQDLKFRLNSGSIFHMRIFWNSNGYQKKKNERLSCEETGMKKWNTIKTTKTFMYF